MPQHHRPPTTRGQEGTSHSATDRMVRGSDANVSTGCALDQQAPVRRLVDAIGSKWALLCLYALDDGPARFNALERRLAGISQKVLAQTLRKLELLGVVTRTVYAEVPPRVVYALTPRGQSLESVLSAMLEWGNLDAAAGRPPSR